MLEGGGMNQHINPKTHDPLAERHWAAIRERVAYGVASVVREIRTPGFQSEVTRYTDTLFDRADRPDLYIDEAVEDARHDLRLIAGIAGEVDLGLDRQFQERLRTATRTLTSMERENADLREWIRDQGQQSDTCTYHILGKEICQHCQCGRAERSSTASSE
jgi:hypothetical protein